jgi:hypothetical protein
MQSGMEGGVFLTGGSFTFTGIGTGGLPAGILFTGNFNGRYAWTPHTLPDGSHHHVLHGDVDGIWLGTSVNNVPMELTVDTQGVSFTSGGQILRGSILLPVSVPEPGSQRSGGRNRDGRNYLR